MKTRVSIDEIIAKRRLSASKSGELFKVAILDNVETKKYDPQGRSQRFTMSSESTDLYGDIVRQNGLDTTNFEKNPVALAFHDGSSPIGWWSDVAKVMGKPKRTEGTITLHPAGTTDAVDEIDALLSVNGIRACSIGFMPTEAEWIMDAEGRNTWGLDFLTSSLLECSICSVPANPDALAKAAAGDMKLAAELFEKVLDTYCEAKTGGLFVRKEFADAYAAMKSRKTVAQVPVLSGDEHIEREMNTIVLDIDTSEAEKKIGGLSAMVDGLIQKAKTLAGLVPDRQVDERFAKYAGCPTFVQHTAEDHSKTVEICGDWPAFFKMTGDVVRLGEESGIIKHDGYKIDVHLANSVAQLSVDHHDEEAGVFYVSLIRSYDPPPKLIKGSRAKALVARERMKEALREKGIPT